MLGCSAGFKLVLLAEVILPFASAEKRSGLADHTSSQEAEPDGSWSLVCLLLVSLMCVCSPVTSPCGSNACASTEGTESWDEGTVSASSGSSISLQDRETGCDAAVGPQAGQGHICPGRKSRGECSAIPLSTKGLSFQVLATTGEHALLMGCVVRDLLRSWLAVEQEEECTGVGREHDAPHRPAPATRMLLWSTR